MTSSKTQVTSFDVISDTSDSTWCLNFSDVIVVCSMLPYGTVNAGCSVRELSYMLFSQRVELYVLYGVHSER